MGFLERLFGQKKIAKPEQNSPPQLRATPDTNIKKMSVREMAFSPDGKLLVVSGGDVDITPSSGQRVSITISIKGSIRIFEAQDYQEKKEIAHGTFPGRVTFSKDGQLVIGVINSSLRSWDAVSGNLLEIFQEDVEEVSFSPDQFVALVRSKSHQLWSIHLSDGRKYGPYPVPEGKGKLLCGGPEELLIVYSRENNLVMKNVAEEVETILGEWSARDISEAQLSPDGRWLAVGSDSGTIGVWDLLEKKKLIDNPLSKKRINSISFAPNSSFVVYGGVDCGVYFCMIHRMEIQACFGEHPFPILAVTVYPDSRHVLSAGLDGTLKLWEVSMQKNGRCSLS